MSELYAIRSRKRFPVESVEEAKAEWEAFRDGSHASVSEIGNGLVIVDAHYRFVARVSYNGRIWFIGERDGGD